MVTQTPIQRSNRKLYNVTKYTRPRIKSGSIPHSHSAARVKSLRESVTCCPSCLAKGRHRIAVESSTTVQDAGGVRYRWVHLDGLYWCRACDYTWAEDFS